MKHVETFRKARIAGCPIVVIRTPDYAATINDIKAVLTKPMLRWDVCRGIVAANTTAVVRANTARIENFFI